MIFASRARMPSPLLPVLDRDRPCFAVHDLHQPAGLADQVGAFLDRGAVGRGAGRGVRASAPVVVASSDLDSAWRGEDAGGQPVERFGQQGLKGRAVFARPAGVGQARDRRCRAAARARPAPSRDARRNSGSPGCRLPLGR